MLPLLGAEKIHYSNCNLKIDCPANRRPSLVEYDGCMNAMPKILVAQVKVVLFQKYLVNRFSDPSLPGPNWHSAIIVKALTVLVLPCRRHIARVSPPPYRDWAKRHRRWFGAAQSGTG
jgi:hypothetical protein